MHLYQMEELAASASVNCAGGHSDTPCLGYAAGSGLDWTAIRPPQLSDKPLTGSYRMAFGQNLRGGLSVPRGAVAHFTLKAPASPTRSATLSASPASGLPVRC